MDLIALQQRPVWRWKSFWLGVLVLVFLGWLWVRSPGGDDQIGFRAAGASWVAYSYRSTVIFGRMYPAGIGSGIGARSPGRPVEFETRKGPGWDVRFCHVAHWFLVVLWCVPWGVFLFWRWRRMKSLTMIPE